MIPVSAIELTTDCSKWPSHFGVPILFKLTLNLIALFDCFGAILYELLIAVLIDLVCQSEQYEAFAGVGEQGKWHLFQKGQILRGTETILGNRECKKTRFEGTEEQANLFQRNKETCTPPTPERASHIT